MGAGVYPPAYLNATVIAVAFGCASQEAPLEASLDYINTIIINWYSRITSIN